MRWSGLSVVVASACAFEPSGQAADGGLRDAGADAPAPAGGCLVVAAGTPVAGGLIGGPGGTTRAALACPAGELPVALAFDRTDNQIANHGDVQLVAGVRVRCGTLTLDGGDVTVVPADELVVRGDGPNCGPYQPVTTTAEVACPAGSVLIGFAVNRPDDSLFNQVVLQCQGLGPTGLLAGATLLVPVAGTGTGSREAQAATCPQGTSVVALTPQAGCGIDALSLTCAALSCAPPQAHGAGNDY
ncbi:MAG: hypothetical protein R3B06_24665 [Kofleriaceae bacterium]